MSESESKKVLEQYLSNDEVYFIDILNFFKRNVKNISIFTFLAIFISIFYSLSIKPTWQGEFQIVLDEGTNSNSPFSSLEGDFGGILPDLNIKNNSIETEIEILKSPLVMKPVFRFSKELIMGNDLKDKNKKLSYKNWLDSKFEVELTEDTYVLNLRYKDNNKKNIIPILNLVSEEYQKYSGRNRNLGISNSINYVNKQISEKKIETKKSLMALQEFSILNNLGSLDGMIPIINGNEEGPAMKNTVGASDRYASHMNILQGLEAELIEKSAFYKKNSSPIIALERKINSVKDSLKRPREILLQFRELSRQAVIDETALADLERQGTLLKIEELKASQPWELITTPTLNDIQIAPRKKEIVRFWALIGLILGVLYSLIMDNKKAIVYSKSKLKSIIPFKLLKTLNFNENQFNFKELQILIISCFNERNISYNLLTFEEDDDYLCDSLIGGLSSKENNIKKASYNDFSQIKKDDINYLLIKEGSVKVPQLTNLIENIELTNIKISGWFYIQN